MAALKQNWVKQTKHFQQYLFDLETAGFLEPHIRHFKDEKGNGVEIHVAIFPCP